jgi:two-component system chemotaxis response regulator CheB
LGSQGIKRIMSLKVLIVDDSALMRKFHKQVLENAGFITEMASNGQECLTQLVGFAPNVIILDINMPVMDGLSCLKEIMATRPTAVVMVSSLTIEGAQTSFDALALGAVDYIQKPNGTYSHNMGELSDLMVEKVIAAANVNPSMLRIRNSQRRQQEDNIRKKAAHKQCDLNDNVKADSTFEQRSSKIISQIAHTPATKRSFELIVVGVSTGGPNCLQTILPLLPKNFTTPIVIAQHMPARFTKVFSERLDSMCALKVVEVTQKQQIKEGHIYIAQGDGDIVVEKLGNLLFVKPTEIDANFLWHPSVSKLVDSAIANVKPKKLCCIQLTGMGNDGAQEMYNAFKLGATTIAESEETAVVFGMPGQLVKKNGATHLAPNYLIATLLT